MFVGAARFAEEGAGRSMRLAIVIGASVCASICPFGSFAQTMPPVPTAQQQAVPSAQKAAPVARQGAAGALDGAAAPMTTRVVMLGTGTPQIDPERSGPATAIVANDTAYLVDFGPGVVRRAKLAETTRGIAALEPARLRVVFATHLHSDHTVGYADLIFTPWTVGRRVPLEVYGPKGIGEMTSHLIEAYRVDIETRTNEHGNQREFPAGHRVNARPIVPGVVYQDDNVRVTAFATKHAMDSYGYRFDTADRSVVISGDTSPAQATIDACNGCDILIHEVHASAWRATRPATFQQFSVRYHTSVPELAELARAARPKLLVIYHWAAASLTQVQQEMQAAYAGHFVVARDLDVY